MVSPLLARVASSPIERDIIRDRVTILGKSDTVLDLELRHTAAGGAHRERTASRRRVTVERASVTS